MMENEKQSKNDKFLGCSLLIVNLIAMCIVLGGVILLGVSSFSMIFCLMGITTIDAIYLGLIGLVAGLILYSIGRAMCFLTVIIKASNEQIYREDTLKKYGLTLASELCTALLYVAGYSLILISIGSLVKWNQLYLYGLIIWGSLFALTIFLKIITHRYLNIRKPH